MPAFLLSSKPLKCPDPITATKLLKKSAEYMWRLALLSDSLSQVASDLADRKELQELC